MIKHRDPRLNHVCEHVLPKQELYRVKPYPKAPYYRYPFTVQCARCRISVLVYCNTERDRTALMATYPDKPKERWEK